MRLVQPKRLDLGMNNPPARFETPDVSIGEIEFGKWFRKTYMRALWPDDDWLDRMTNTLFELKTVGYPKSHFDGVGVLKVNKVSLQNHMAKRGRYSKVVVVLYFADKTMLFGKLEEVLASGKDLPFTQIDDRPTIMVPLAIFKASLEEVK